MKRIAILGGSFNPPHLGHVGMAQYVLGRHLADEVWVVPCADHPYAKPLAPFADRMEMCSLAFQGIAQVIVSDLESKLSQPSYTVQTLRHLSTAVRPKPVEGATARGSADLSRAGSLQFFLIVGSDIAADVPNWKDGTEIACLAKLIEVPRGEGSPIPNVSGTEIRRRVHQGKPIMDQVPAPVARYIQSHRLYR